MAVRVVPPRRLPFDREWRDEAVKRAAALGLGQKELGRLTDIAQGTLSHVLGEEPKAWQSDYVERLSAFLEMDLPLLARMLIVGERAYAAGKGESLKAVLRAFEVLLEPKS